MRYYLHDPKLDVPAKERGEDRMHRTKKIGDILERDLAKSDKGSLLNPIAPLMRQSRRVNREGKIGPPISPEEHLGTANGVNRLGFDLEMAEVDRGGRCRQIHVAEPLQ
jgi:hypothetical protein